MSKKLAHVPTAAAEIVELIVKVGIHNRLELFNLVRENLQLESQYFTARCFQAVCVLYKGVENTEDEPRG